MLRKYLEDTGDLFFKYRSYIPVILYVLATIALILDKDNILTHNSMFWNVTCLTVSLFGLFIRVMTIGYVPKNTSGRNTKEGQIADTINTTGMYSLVRHPLYVGNFFMWMGLVLYVAIPWFIILSILFFWILYERIMLAEERFVRNRFTEEFDAWAKQTPAFIPWRFRWKKSNRDFSIKKVMRREYTGILALSVSFVYLDALKNYLLHTQIDVSLFWIITSSIGAIVWFTLRSLRKWTNILESKHKD